MLKSIDTYSKQWVNTCYSTGRIWKLASINTKHTRTQMHMTVNAYTSYRLRSSSYHWDLSCGLNTKCDCATFSIFFFYLGFLEVQNFSSGDV